MRFNSFKDGARISRLFVLGDSMFFMKTHEIIVRSCN